MQSDKIYAVIDTNIIVLAFYSKDGLSNPAVIINNVLSNNILPLYNNEIIREYEEVLRDLNSISLPKLSLNLFQI